MQESTKRAIDWLALLALGLPAAILWFDYANNTHPSKNWVVLLMVDIPFAAAALIWLGCRLFGILLREEKTKRIIDWLSLIPLGTWPAMLVWSHYAHIDHPSTIWIALGIINIPLAFAATLWLVLRLVDKNS